jgi:hypothetical protein
VFLEVNFMRALLCDYVGADRADQVAHKSYVPRQMAGFGWDSHENMSLIY